MPRLLAAAAGAALLALLALVAVPAAAGSPALSLAEVQPENGATITRPPDEAVLTFTADLDPDRSTATLAAPGREDREAPVDVEGDRLVVDVAGGGTGQYVVGYSVVAAGAPPDAAPVQGSVGFTVDPQAADAPSGGAAPWAAASAIAVAGLLAALVVTARRWQSQR